nr:hypothetical protein [uncultured Mediterranean phage uvMED]
MAYTTIKKPSDYFNTKLYNGTAANQSITGIGFQPDFTWIKIRTTGFNHRLQDSVRGATKSLYTNLTNTEQTNTDGVLSFDTDGFSLGNDASNGSFNRSGDTFVSWNWKAGTSVSGTTTGSGTSKAYSGSVNTTSGFSIIKYIGNGTAGHQIPHHLGAVPKMIILKNITGGSENWYVYHASLGNNKDLLLNLTNDATGTVTTWNNTTPTSTVWTMSDQSAINSTDGNDHIAYCFAEKTGYSKFGSYTGTSSEVFIYTGFKPKFILIKKTSEAASWHLFDTSRTVSNGGNQLNKILFPNLSNAEVDDAYNYVDAYSNGFRCFSGPSGQGTETNKNGQTFIYMAIAEEPLVGDNPATAR